MFCVVFTEQFSFICSGRSGEDHRRRVNYLPLVIRVKFHSSITWHRILQIVKNTTVWNENVYILVTVSIMPLSCHIFRGSLQCISGIEDTSHWNVEINIFGLVTGCAHWLQTHKNPRLVMTHGLTDGRYAIDKNANTSKCKFRQKTCSDNQEMFNFGFSLNSDLQL